MKETKNKPVGYGLKEKMEDKRKVTCVCQDLNDDDEIAPRITVAAKSLKVSLPNSMSQLLVVMKPHECSVSVEQMEKVKQHRRPLFLLFSISINDFPSS